MKHLFSLILLFLLPAISAGQESIPPYHWAWNHLAYLRSAGYLQALDFSNRPLTRELVFQALQDELATDKEISQPIKGMLQDLFAEFRPDAARGSTKADVILKLAGFAESAYSNQNDDFDDKFNYRIHPQLRMNIGRQMSLFGHMQIVKEPETGYIGKKYRNLYSFMEQAYLVYRGKYLSAKIGRDYLQIGAGRSGQLLLSDNSRPFDMYFVRLGGKAVGFEFFGIQLDRRLFSDPQLQTPVAANRFLNGHRLSFNYQNRFYTGISEVVVYGGKNRMWELGYMNPFGFYYSVNVNGPYPEANLLYSIDWNLYLPQHLNAYGELLIDDLQVDRKEPGDLEPDETGLQLGLNWANPFGITGTLLNTEYVQIRNRTYNAPVNDWEKYLHRNRVIGYSLGNDFKLYRLGAEKWLSPQLKISLFGQLVWKGEGTVAGEFNKDYLQYTVDEGYDEPFPWGIVEKHTQLGVSLFFRPHPLAVISSDLAYNTFSNYRHKEGAEREEFSFRIYLWLQYFRLFNMN